MYTVYSENNYQINENEYFFFISEFNSNKMMLNIFLFLPFSLHFFSLQSLVHFAINSQTQCQLCFILSVVPTASWQNQIITLQAFPNFYCKNCKYKQHQCFVCGELGSSDVSSKTEVYFRYTLAVVWNYLVFLCLK